MNFDKSVLNINYVQGSMLGSGAGCREGKGTMFASRELKCVQLMLLECQGIEGSIVKEILVELNY